MATNQGTSRCTHHRANNCAAHTTVDGILLSAFTTTLLQGKLSAI
jgi:hypothetical protein